MLRGFAKMRILFFLVNKLEYCSFLVKNIVET
jgi:hypothetical protein